MRGTRADYSVANLAIAIVPIRDESEARSMGAEAEVKPQKKGPPGWRPR